MYDEVLRKLKAIEAELERLRAFDVGAGGGGGGTGDFHDHDHSASGDEGGTFDAANLESDGATDGQVLTADGVGGAAWEDATGGNTVSEGPGIDLVTAGIDKQVGLGGDTILLYKIGGSPVAEYAATDAGLDLAGAAVTNEAEIIVIPSNASLSATHTLAACTYIFPPELIVTGKLIMAAGTVVIYLNSAVEDTDNGAAIVGVQGPNSGEAHLYDCRIVPVNNGSGGVHAVHVSLSGDLICHNCYLNGQGALGGGSGYAGYRDPECAGTLRIEGGAALGSSADDPFNE